MDREDRVMAGLLVALGAVVLLGLAVYPFDYGVLESALLATLLVVAGLFRTVLDDAL